MFLATALLLAGAASTSETDVFAQSRQGKLLCVSPNVEARTCSSILAYAPGPDGALLETAELMLAPAQGLTFEVTTRAEPEGSALCGTVQLADFDKAVVRVKGAPLPPDRTAAVVAAIKQRVAPMAGKRSCEVLRVVDGALLKFGEVESVDLKLPGKPVKWVDPGEGYRVAVPAARR